VSTDLVGVPELPFPLRAHGPDGDWSYADGVLTGRAGPRQDRFVPPTGEALDTATDAPRLLGAPDGDFQLVARVTVGFTGAFDAGVLYVHVGERAWAKLCLEYSPDVPTVCTVVTRGHSDDANAFVVDGDSVWLRVRRTGRAFAFHASPDGERWTFVRLFTLGDEKETGAALVGFMVQAPMGEGCTVTYDHLEFRPTCPADLRDGE
jgi:regulation of enolase protein 1 (concanavalin A-like superfamily)